MNNDILAQKFAHILEQNFELKLTKFIVALSGGVDSMVLAILANNWAKEQNAELLTVTIDHGLRDEAKQEALSVQHIMQSLNIKHKIIKWEHQENITSNLEAKAREARYELLSNYALENQVKVIFTAHHLDDQIENFFIRLSRGSGIDGLAAMAHLTQITKELLIFRPFLTVKKAELNTYAKAQKLEWFEDQTNQDRKYLRNDLRHILAQIEDKEVIERRIIKSGQHFARARDFLQITTAKEYHNIVENIAGDLKLNLVKFKNLHAEIALRILVKILMEIGQTKYKPRFAKLEMLYEKIKQDKIVKSTSFNHCLIKIKEDHLIFTKELNTRS